MGRGRNATGFPGVEIHRDRVRIRFTYCGVRCAETLPGPVTPAGLRYAGRLRAEIVEKIRTGAFRFAEYFPDSPALAKLPGIVRPAVVTFGEYAEKWLATHRAATSTGKAYAIAVAFWSSQFGATRLDRVRLSDVREAIASRAWGNGKTLNNYLIPLRQVFALALEDGLVERNPAAPIRNAKVQKDEPDPLTLDEVAAVLEHMARAYPPGVADYFRFAFGTGLRPSELIALEWGDVDFRAGVVRVSRAKVGGEVKTTKTNRVRFVDLTPPALAAINAQKARTALAGGVVFTNPITGRAWNSSESQIKAYWRPTLRALGMRARDAYQTRHTFASTLLSAGIPPGYIAAQLGHASLKMTLEVYARWIPTTDESGRNRAAAAAAFGPGLAPKNSAAG